MKYIELIKYLLIISAKFNYYTIYTIKKNSQAILKAVTFEIKL